MLAGPVGLELPEEEREIETPVEAVIETVDCVAFPVAAAELERVVSSVSDAPLEVKLSVGSAEEEVKLSSSIEHDA